MSVADHNSRLSRAEAEIRELRRSVDAIFGKLDTIASALTDMRATSGPALRDILSFVRDGAVLFSLVVGGILYLSNVTNGRTVSDLEARLTRLETIIGMATVRRSTPGAWTGN